MASGSIVTPQLLFKTAAVLHGIAAPGHIARGFQFVYPALKKIPTTGKTATQEDRIGQRGAESCWNWVTGSLIISAALNWQWAHTGGPQSMEETVTFWTVVVTGLVNGFRYLQVDEYAAGSLLALTGGVSAAAYLLTQK